MTSKCHGCETIRDAPFAVVKVKNATADKCVRVHVKFTGIPCCDQTVTEYLQEVDNVYARDEQFRILYDARELGIPTMTMLQQQATFMRAKDDHTKRIMQKCAIVTSSTLVNTLLDTLFTLKPPATDLHVFSDIEGAKAFLRS